MVSKADNKELSDSSSTAPTLLAWCSYRKNKVDVTDLETKKNYVTFDGVKISEPECANMEVFDISKKGKANKISSLGEVSGTTGPGDVTYNSRRGILAAIPVIGRMAFHLFNVDAYASNTQEIVKLSRKSKWHSQNSTRKENYIAGFDFNPAGESIATMDTDGVCLISDVNTDDYVFHLEVGSLKDWGRCRWSPNTGEPFLFVKYNYHKLNILDVEKKALILSDPVHLERINYTRWIDVCPSNANLLASGGDDSTIYIVDKRESKIVKTFEGIQTITINCVRWSPTGDMIASAASDNTAKLLDFKTGKVLYTGNTSDKNSATCVCLI